MLVVFVDVDQRRDDGVGTDYGADLVEVEVLFDSAEGDETLDSLDQDVGNNIESESGGGLVSRSREALLVKRSLPKFVPYGQGRESSRRSEVVTHHFGINVERY